MGLWQSLTRRRDIPEVPTWVAAAALLCLAAYAGWAAVRPEGPPVTDNRDTAQVLQDSRELIAHGEALMQAMRDNDQRQVKQLEEELVARSRREAEREGKRAAAVKAARTWYAVIAALNFAVGAWLVLMRRIVFVALLGVTIALLTLALSTRGKEGMLIFFLGAAILLCTLVVGGLRFSSELFSKGKTPTTNTSAILGALIGLFIGGFVGARSDLGRVMISVFNPDLPEHDFGTSFGAIGGGILGAFFLALVSGLLRMLIVRPEKAVPVESPEDSVPDSRGDTA